MQDCKIEIKDYEIEIKKYETEVKCEKPEQPQAYHYAAKLNLRSYRSKSVQHKGREKGGLL